MEPTIKLKTVLAEIDQLGAQGRPFALDYVKRGGQLGRKVRLMKGGNSGGADYQPAEGSAGLGYNLKLAGLLLVRDLETGQMRTLKIRRLTHYNSVRILHG